MTNKRTPPICVDCRWHNLDWRQCDNPESHVFDPIHGGTYGVEPMAARGATGACGPDGNLWEAKPKRPIWDYLVGPAFFIVAVLVLALWVL